MLTKCTHMTILSCQKHLLVNSWQTLPFEAWNACCQKCCLLYQISWNPSKFIDCIQAYLHLIRFNTYLNTTWHCLFFALSMWTTTTANFLATRLSGKYVGFTLFFPIFTATAQQPAIAKIVVLLFGQFYCMGWAYTLETVWSWWYYPRCVLGANRSKCSQ